MTDQLITLKNHRKLANLYSGANNSRRGILADEVRHLAWLAAQVPEGGNIVEVGSNRGKAICVMGTSCMEAGNITANLFAIDLWTKGVGKTFSHYATQETWEMFNTQVAEMGLTNMITPIMMDSLKAASRRSKPIHLLFIDANHKYDHVVKDYEAWSVFVPSGGYIAFHDYGGRFEGVTRTVDEIVFPSGLWEDPHQYKSVWSARRK